LAAAAAVRLEQADVGGARALLEEIERTPHVRDNVNYGRCLPEAVRTALAAEDPELAARLTQDIEPVYPLHEHALITTRALLAEHRGGYAEALGAFADAADRWDRFEMPWERAHALLGQGRCQIVLGRASEATAALRDAREIFASLDAKPALAETDAHLARAVALSS
jgi:tetratricopeptide (TPR) repeat protein